MNLRKFPWEIPAALLFNLFIFALFFIMKTENPVRPEKPPEIVLDISDFTIPQPQPLEPAEGEAGNDEQQGGGGPALSPLAAAEDASKVARNAMRNFSPGGGNAVSILKPTVDERVRDLNQIEKGIRTFDGLNNVSAGISAGTLPSGHSVGASFQGRGDGVGRKKSLKKHGGDENTEGAVAQALKYLASVQNPNGSWGSEASLKNGESVALSSLALLTFFANGENFNSKEHGEKICKGTDYLIELANTPNIEFAGHSFGHAILAYALAEAYALNGGIGLREALERRLKTIVAKQNKFGSFASDYDNTAQPPPTAEQQKEPLYREVVTGEPMCDLSLLGWHIQALTAAKNAGVTVDGLDKALTLATEALVKIHQAKKGGFSHGINMKRFEPDENMTPVGLLGLQILNESKSIPARRAEHLLEKVPLPRWKASAKFPLYRWYYQTQTVFQSENGRGKRWEQWNENLKKELLEAQQQDGSWSMPAGDNSYRVKDKKDLTIYGTSLCSLMLQVYYRYLPSYSIAEYAAPGAGADAFDLGAGGLVTRLPGGVDPMASAILGIGVADMPPVRFGKFDGMPEENNSPHVKDEFKVMTSMRSTVPIKQVNDWPQLLQPNQRLALFLDDFIPRNFKGHLRLTMGIVSSQKDSFDCNASLDAVLNGKRLYNSYLLRNKQLVSLLVPKDFLQPYGNILQIRNNGKTVLAFDAAELSAVTQVGQRLYFLAEDRQNLPESIRFCFNTDIPENPFVCKLPGTTENRTLLAEIKTYEPQKCYIADYSPSGSERMGNEFHKHYLRQTGREVIDWIASGGTGIYLRNILSGGRFFDTIFQTEYPAASALRRVGRLFEGAPHKLDTQIIPKYGEKPLLYTNSAGAYNAPGIATIVIAKRFPFPDETEVCALIPWNGNTEMILEKGFLNEKSEFSGFAQKIETETKNITIENNIFRYSGVFPEMTVIRLVRKGESDLHAPMQPRNAQPSLPRIEFNFHDIRKQLPPEAKNLKSVRIREAGGFAAAFGENVNFSKIPVTVIENNEKNTPPEKESILITFQTNTMLAKSKNSVFLSFGNAPDKAKYLIFHVLTRTSGTSVKEKKGRQTNRQESGIFRFALGSKCFSTVMQTDSWQTVVVPLETYSPAWQSLRIIEPDPNSTFYNKKANSVSFEFNDISVLY